MNTIIHIIAPSKIKPADVKSSIGVGVENNDKDPKFEFGDHVRRSTYQEIFILHSKLVSRNFVIKKVKTLCHGHM